MITDRRLFNKQQFGRIAPETREAAVNLLRKELPLHELEDRIIENPSDWLRGRDNQLCWLCGGDGAIWVHDRLNATEVETYSEVCGECRGTGRAREPGLHHGWGTAVRNLLRARGYGERELKVDNLDDYYVALVEAAVMGEDYVTNYSPEETHA
jgi:hypothetical protein